MFEESGVQTVLGEDEWEGHAGLGLKTREPLRGLVHPEADDLDQLSRTLTNRLLHDVTAALRSAPADDDALRALLSLDDG